MEMHQNAVNLHLVVIASFFGIGLIPQRRGKMEVISKRMLKQFKKYKIKCQVRTKEAKVIYYNIEYLNQNLEKIN